MPFSGAVSPEAEKVRDLARLGRLADAYRDGSAAQRSELRAGLCSIACQVVLQRITVPVERGRGHGDCMAGVERMRPDCLDRFHEAVEAVVNDTLRKAALPILRLDAWMASRASAVTVDDHRSRRGGRGAQQRPHVPQWLRRALDDDPWLVELALSMLTWVGIPDTAGTAIWPVGAWAERRAVVTGDHRGSDSATVHRDIDRVRDAMRHRPSWYYRYLEWPLDRKPIAVTPPHRTADGVLTEPPPLELVDADERHDIALRELAAECIDAIRIGLTGPRVDAAEVVRRAVQVAFGADRHDLAGAPPSFASTDIDELLSDPAAVNRIVAAALDIIDGVDPADPVHQRPTG